MANAWLKWLKGEGNIAAINPPSDTEESTEHVDNRIVRDDILGDSCPGMEEEKENTDDENINIEVEVENESGRIVDRIIRGEQIM